MKWELLHGSLPSAPHCEEAVPETFLVQPDTGIGFCAGLMVIAKYLLVLLSIGDHMLSSNEKGNIGSIREEEMISL
jgi:hypothetical protein